MPNVNEGNIMKQKISQNIDLKYLISRAVSSTVKLSVCAIAPMASTKIFSTNSDSVRNVLTEVSGSEGDGNKFLAFLTCGANVISNDVIDTFNWISEIDLIEDILEYASKFTHPDGVAEVVDKSHMAPESLSPELISEHNDTMSSEEYYG